jgi:hypothetical protein
MRNMPPMAFLCILFVIVFNTDRISSPLLDHVKAVAILLALIVCLGQLLLELFKNPGHFKSVDKGTFSGWIFLVKIEVVAALSQLVKLSHRSYNVLIVHTELICLKLDRLKAKKLVTGRAIFWLRLEHQINDFSKFFRIAVR